MTPNEFPYIKAIHVNDCFAYQNFDIELPPLNGQPFSHLILTGKNGSGKTTILRGVEEHVGFRLLGIDKYSYHSGYYDEDSLKDLIRQGQTSLEMHKLKNRLIYSQSVNLSFTNNSQIIQFKGKSILSAFAANRQEDIVDVDIPTKETVFFETLVSKGSTKYFSQYFKQYLVNKKVQQAFYQLNKDVEGIKITELFFEKFTKLLQRFFEDNALSLIFEDKNYEFYVILEDKRRITFNQMSDGFSSFITILVDLLIRVDLICSEVKDNNYEPCGIVLLDEPESHLHIKAQYEVLPILTEFFPNVQFIVATHSPAVISSIKNTTIFDLTSQSSVTDEVVGSSFSELMVTHFGLDNEFSPIADEIIDNVEKAVKETKEDKPLLKQRLQDILIGNERYLSPTLRLELESLILENS